MPLDDIEREMHTLSTASLFHDAPVTADCDMRRLYGKGDVEPVGYAVKPLPAGGHVLTTTATILLIGRP